MKVDPGTLMWGRGAILAACTAICVGLIVGGLTRAGAAGDDVAYSRQEPRALYAPAALDRASALWLNYSYRALAHGDLATAIEQMQIAVNRLVERRNDDFELWDNLAELYCAQAKRARSPGHAAAARANGLALLKEYRCGVDFFSRGDAGMPCHTARGLLLSPEFTPLCYQLFCSAGPRDTIESFLPPDNEEDQYSGPQPRELYLARYRDDAANLPQIEKVCHAPQQK